MSRPASAPDDVQSVSELARQVRSVLDGSFESVWVRGELSGFRAYGSGHWYFSIKDDDAQLKCAMFAGSNRRVRFRPKDGDEVLLRGRVDLYSKRGDLQLVADRMESVGEGRLHQEFERLKAALKAEGLFDDARKRPLPAVPRRLGIVTSEQAAALQDMLRVLADRDPTLSITLSPARVQGTGAAETIAAALDLLNRASDVEVILCGRGGGSIEDLWAFNEEVVARAIARSRIPVISGVGHEIDFTIADFVADRRAPTPTAAAEMAVPVRAELEALVADRRARLVRAQGRALERRAQRVDELGQRLRAANPRRRIALQEQRLRDAQRRLRGALERGLQRRQERIASLVLRHASANPSRRLAEGRRRLGDLSERLERATLVGLSAHRERLEADIRALRMLGPLQSLGRGYAIATSEDSGLVVRDAVELRAGDALRLRLRVGALKCRVEEVITDAELDLRGRVRK